MCPDTFVMNLYSLCVHAQQSLWIERTTLILSRPLPGISRWAEVERREVVSGDQAFILFQLMLHTLVLLRVLTPVAMIEREDGMCLYKPTSSPLLWILLIVSVNFQVEVSPLENAIYVVENKTQELRTLISQYQHRQHHGNINPLSMCLNGVIDAAVNGGIARYQEVDDGKEFYL